MNTSRIISHAAVLRLTLIALIFHLALSVSAQGPATGGPVGPYPDKVVTAANWIAQGTNVTGDNVHMGLAQQGPVSWAITRYGRGDFAVRLSPFDPVQALTNLNLGFINYANETSNSAAGQVWLPDNRRGILIPTVRQNGPIDYGDGDGAFYPTIATSEGSSGNGYDMIDGTYHGGKIDINTGKSGKSGGSSVAECNVNFATAWFPYAQGWVGGDFSGPDVLGNPSWLDGLGESHSPLLSTSIITWIPDAISGLYVGLADLSLPGVHSVNDGMLFTVSSEGSSQLQVSSAVPLPDGSAWKISIRNQAELNQEVLVPNTAAQFKFLFVPYSSAKLIGGHVNGADGSLINSRGTFTMTRTGTGTYELTIPGKTGTNGVLLLGSAGFATTVNQTTASRDVLSYEYNSGSGKFVIQSLYPTSSTTVALEDNDFYFVWVDFQEPLEFIFVPPAPTATGPVGPYPTSLTAANWIAQGTNVTGDNVHMGLAQQGPVPWAITRYGRGDFAVRLSPLDPGQALTNLNLGFINYANETSNSAAGQVWLPDHNRGIIIPTVRQNGPIDYGDGDGAFFPTIATSEGSSGNGYDMVDGTYHGGKIDINTGKSGRSGGSSVAECNVNFATTWFPYSQGWIGGDLSGPDALGTPSWLDASGNSHSPLLSTNIITWIPDAISGLYVGLADLSLPGIHSLNDGMLFTASSEGSSQLQISSAAPQPDGSAWKISIRNQAELNQEVLVPNTAAQFKFVFVPYTAANLIGGHVNGADGSLINSRGTFTLTRTNTGTYELTIPGKTGTNGVLLLGSAGFATTVNQATASRDVLSYEYNSGTGKFVIQSIYPTSSTTVAFEDNDFYFAWVDFANPFGVTLRSFAAGNNVVVSWPTNAPGFFLDYTTSLNPVDWKPLLLDTAIVGGEYHVTNTPPLGATRFFRLRKP